MDLTASTAATLHDYLDALLSGDLNRIRAYFAPDATWRIHGTLPLAGLYDGADAIMDFLATAMSGLFVSGTQKFTFGKVLADGETAILEWNVTGTAAATGQQYDNDYCGIFIIRDKRIHAVREYFDTDHARHALYAVRAGDSQSG
jgi:ketosteroid isomerase-like protein